MANPCPVPRPTSLVVKNGSTIRHVANGVGDTATGVGNANFRQFAFTSGR